jgi:hypothetical protein
MVEAMGEEKEKFKRYCFLAYTTLRKSSNLILNLVSLMIDAGIEHINQGDKSVLKVCSRKRNCEFLFFLDLLNYVAHLLSVSRARCKRNSSLSLLMRRRAVF